MICRTYTYRLMFPLREQSCLKIVAVGYTIYPGSEFEHEMLREASRIIFKAH